MRRFLFAALIAVMATPALAAVTQNAWVTVQTPKLALVQFLQGTDTAGTYKTLYTGGTNGTKVKGLWETNNDGSATHLVTCQLVRSSVLYGGVAVTTASNDGFANAVPAKNFMSAGNWPGLPLDSDGNPFFYLQSGDLLQCTFATALTASTLINMGAVVEDF